MVFFVPDPEGVRRGCWWQSHLKIRKIKRWITARKWKAATQSLGCQPTFKWRSREKNRCFNMDRAQRPYPPYVWKRACCSLFHSLSLSKQLSKKEKCQWTSIWSLYKSKAEASPAWLHCFHKPFPFKKSFVRWIKFIYVGSVHWWEGGRYMHIFIISYMTLPLFLIIQVHYHSIGKC